MHVIHKFPLKPTMQIALPMHAKVLSVQVQNGAPVMWVLLDPDEERYPRNYVAYFTGEFFNLTRHHSFIDTFQTDGLVFHLFEDTSQ